MSVKSAHTVKHSSSIFQIIYYHLDNLLDTPVHSKDNFFQQRHHSRHLLASPIVPRRLSPLPCTNLSHPLGSTVLPKDGCPALRAPRTDYSWQSCPARGSWQSPRTVGNTALEFHLVSSSFKCPCKIRIPVRVRASIKLGFWLGLELTLGFQSGFELALGFCSGFEPALGFRPGLEFCRADSPVLNYCRRRIWDRRDFALRGVSYQVICPRGD